METALGSLENILNEMKMEIGKWFHLLSKKDTNKIVGRTKLQVGVHDYGLLEYREGEISIYDSDLDFMEPSVKSSCGIPVESLTKEIIHEFIKPQLAIFVMQELDALKLTTLIDYKFVFWGKFRVQGGEVNTPLVTYINEEKKQLLLESILNYIKICLDQGKTPTKSLETFFLSKHLLDQELFPKLDQQRVVGLFNKVLELNKVSKSRLEEHRGNIIRSLQNWVEDQFLPRYYTIKEQEWHSRTYIRKNAGISEEIDHSTLELLFYTAIAIIKYEPAYSKNTGIEFLNRAEELGGDKASLLKKEGSGTFAKEEIYYHDENVECKANDIFSTITIVIRKEAQESYAQALRFIIHLLERGFPASYQIKLKSSEKQFLPIKGLAKSGTHRFFANALAYKELRILLEQYARAAMREYEWYEDAEGEKCSMPGTFTVFGLGLADQDYFPLIKDYMEMVDTEHQSVQNGFTAAFIEKYGVTENVLSTLVVCLLHCTDTIKLKVKDQMEEENILPQLLQEMTALQRHQAEHIIYTIWGGSNKLKTSAAKAKGEKHEWLTQLLLTAAR
ncbi:DUF6138 family protein [Paenibacillus luteus]|uniref:DUF6138 family protein n=1 Tax=Paenibacillus luteus TaxID=2545753 RepID=UPI001144C397|nr:DUF6138 family protein [Paenibacillus luteus]